MLHYSTQSMFTLQTVDTQVGRGQPQLILRVAGLQSSRSLFYFLCATIFFDSIFFDFERKEFHCLFLIFLYSTLSLCQNLPAFSKFKSWWYMETLVLHGNQALGSESETPGMRETGKWICQLVFGSMSIDRTLPCPLVTSHSACSLQEPLLSSFSPIVSKTVNQYFVSQIV